MSLIVLAIVLVVVCLALYAVQAFLPGPSSVKGLLCFVIVLIAIAWMLGGGSYVRVHL